MALWADGGGRLIQGVIFDGVLTTLGNALISKVILMMRGMSGRGRRKRDIPHVYLLKSNVRVQALKTIGAHFSHKLSQCALSDAVQRGWLRCVLRVREIGLETYERPDQYGLVDTSEMDRIQSGVLPGGLSGRRRTVLGNSGKEQSESNVVGNQVGRRGGGMGGCAKALTAKARKTGYSART